MMTIPFPAFDNTLIQRYPVVSMDYEGANGSTTFTDDGTQASTWTRSGANVTISTAQILDGTSSLLVNGDSDYLQTDLTSSNGLPATGDWDIEFRMRLGSVTSRYVLSAQGTSANASDTHFAIVTNISGNLAFIVSNGTTRQVLFSSSAENISTNTVYLTRISRRQNEYIISLNGSITSRATFSGNINQPAGRKIRIGLGEAAGTTTGSPFYFDSFRIFRYA